MRDRHQTHVTSEVDGRKRHVDDEQRLNEAFRILFAEPTGEVVLKYLRRITIETVAPPEATDAHLRHQEGMRDVVRIIQQRIQLGKERR